MVREYIYIYAHTNGRESNGKNEIENDMECGIAKLITGFWAILKIRTLVCGLHNQDYRILSVYMSCWGSSIVGNCQIPLRY